MGMCMARMGIITDGLESGVRSLALGVGSRESGVPIMAGLLQTLNARRQTPDALSALRDRHPPGVTEKLTFPLSRLTRTRTQFMNG